MFPWAAAQFFVFLTHTAGINASASCEFDIDLARLLSPAEQNVHAASLDRKKTKSIILINNNYNDISPEQAEKIRETLNAINKHLGSLEPVPIVRVVTQSLNGRNTGRSFIYEPCRRN